MKFIILEHKTHVAVSFEQPEYTADVDALGTLRIFRVFKKFTQKTSTKFYQASSSELYGKSLRFHKLKNSFLPKKVPMLLLNYMHIGLLN